MEKDDEDPVEEVEEEILDYLRDHPRAADTLDGVVHWWLLHQRYLRGLESVERALDELVARGLVERRTNLDGSVVYAAAPRRDGGE